MKKIEWVPAPIQPLANHSEPSTRHESYDECRKVIAQRHSTAPESVVLQDEDDYTVTAFVPGNPNAVAWIVG